MHLSVVFPCLDEAETLGQCIEEVHQSLRDAGIEYEIVVADNGSTDDSRDIAEAHGARVVPVNARGYGAALRGGLDAARGVYAAFADADGSYILSDMAALYNEAVRQDADMAVASRLKGRIEPGAMPLLHRRLGTPVLTALINLLFSGRVSDCNSGFRCLRLQAYRQWQVTSSGMEFASELLIKALKHGATIVETQSGLRCDRRSRPPHLRTWRDGMRHLLFILSEKPQLFEWLGIALLLVTSVLQIAAFAVGPTKLGPFNVFDYHTQTLLLPLGCFGIQMYLFSCYLFLSGDDKRSMLTENVLAIDEAHLFFLLIALVAMECVGFFFVFLKWFNSNFGNIDMIRQILFMTHFLCVVGFFTLGLLGIHMFNKRFTNLLTGEQPASD